MRLRFAPCARVARKLIYRLPGQAGLAWFQGSPSLTMALRVTMSFRMTAGWPPASRARSSAIT